MSKKVAPPNPLTDENKPRIIECFKNGYSMYQICKEFHVTRIDVEPLLLGENLISESDCKYPTSKKNGVREFRISTELSQAEFSQYFNVPIRTLQEWEQGRANPPSYLLNLIKRIWELESINKK